MAKKTNPLLKAVSRDTVEKAPAVTTPSRSGKKLIAGHFSPEVAKALKMVAVEDDTTVQALVGEALTLLFQKKNVKISVE